VCLDGCTFAVDHRSISNDDAHLLFTGKYEKPERIAISRFLDHASPVVELGGCMGVVSCITNRLLNNPERHVVVEANPGIIPLLEHNRSLNRSSFQVIHAAVAYEAASVSFRPHPQTALGGTIDISRPGPIPSVRLASVLEQAGFERCSLISDIEGSELDLIRNEAKILAQHVSCLIIEIHDDILGTEATQEIIATVATCGFSRVYRSWGVYGYVKQP
jgi:FkbM family methyltransferase